MPLAQAPVQLSSPDESVIVTLDVTDAQRLHYAVQYEGEAVVQDSPFTLAFESAPPFGEGMAIRSVERRRVDTTWQRHWGKRAEVQNRFNEVALQLEETKAPGRRVRFVVRAYDDGVAFRYVLPSQWDNFALASERSVFRFAGEPTVWAANHGGFHSSQENEFNEMPMRALSPDSVYGLPMLVHVDADRWVALTEADLTDWAGLYLTRSEGQPSALGSVLSPLPEAPEVAVRSEAPRRSPWRVLMLAGEASDLIGADLVHNLNDPAEGDFAWVEPGISSWNWWNGPYLPAADFEVGMNTETMKAYVDLAADMGWEYVLVDEGWYGPAFDEDGFPTPHPTSDITTVIPELDLQELIRYASERGVEPWLWLHWGHVDDQMDEAFALYEKWNVAGVKIDFMDRDDQKMVNFYHRVVREAAEHELMVNFHGAYKPTGVSRTYPNLVTREGVMGAEYNKWSARVTPEHNVTLPFTRGLLGEMDYTPGGFRNKSMEAFRPQNTAPFVMGTRTHQLAMFVIYESALQVASDSPYNYRTSPEGTDLLKMVSATWDDTKAINGQPGDYVTVARRSGDAWYVASMSDEEGRTLEIPLDFLGEGRYEAAIWQDAYESADYPRELMKATQTVTARDTLTAKMAPGGGYVARLTPVRE